MIDSTAAARLLLALAGGFALGSLPFSVWIGRRAAGLDVRRHGSRNPGAANVWQTVGRVSGVLVGAADAGKGALAVWVAWWLGLPDELAVWAGVAAVLGHDFSPWLGFSGGKGGATTCGALACFIFPELVVVLILWIVASVLDPRRRFLWSLVTLSTCPILAALAGGSYRRPAPVIAAAALLVVLLWARVAPGLRHSHG